MTEPWLRGPIPGIPPLLQPVAHALLMSREDIDRAVEGLTPDQVWMSPGGAATIGFHVAHLSGATDRLFTYARGEVLTPEQRDTYRAEAKLSETRPSLDDLLTKWHETIEIALAQLRATREEDPLEPREVGRDRLPSNVLGLLFHAAEHASRHTGQVVTTSKVVRATRP
jgi:uncharacterized damage-inducible protein DinB